MAELHIWLSDSVTGGLPWPRQLIDRLTSNAGTTREPFLETVASPHFALANRADRAVGFESGDSCRQVAGRDTGTSGDEK
jgi:hypothetical protein